MGKTIAVIDIGKTNAKVVLVDAATLSEVAARTTPNGVVDAPPYPHYDTERLWAFILDSLAGLNAERRIDVISVTTHGATAALVADDGSLALPVLDYEHAGPQEALPAFARIRPPFEETGTPRLPGGLNAGLQIFWQSRRFPDAFARVRHILMYAQYWTFRLTGVAASEVTSLGCHADLWEPRTGRFSDLVAKEGWLGRMPPMRRASDVLGPILPDIAVQTGLSPDTPVHCGIHDSNASLLPYVLTLPSPYAVVSTGTWVVVLAMGARDVALDEERDTLVNVNARGEPVPSARFMGGRAFSLLGGANAPIGEEALVSVLERKALLLPAIPEDSGPFRGRKPEWTVPRERLSEEEAQAVIAFYLALMTATCLRLVGADGPVIVEGPFALNEAYLSMLGAATGREVLKGEGATGTSAGAACLAADRVTRPILDAVTPKHREAMRDYASAWTRRVEDGLGEDT